MDDQLQAVWDETAALLPPGWTMTCDLPGYRTPCEARAFQLDPARNETIGHGETPDAALRDLADKIRERVA